MRSVSRELKTRTWRSVHIVTPFDSGGSSARLRTALGMPAIGDLRNRLLALADESTAGSRSTQVFLSHRFAAGGERELREQHAGGDMMGMMHDRTGI